jgi:hypothetical protein
VEFIQNHQNAMNKDSTAQATVIASGSSVILVATGLSKTCQVGKIQVCVLQEVDD